MVDLAMQNGASFIVCPGMDVDIVNYCLSKNILVIPGCVTPSEIISAIKCGLKLVKFFPAEAIGGVKMLKALSAPFKDIYFMPTGGITEDNLHEYLKMNSVLACGGSFLATNKMIENDEFDLIKNISQKTIKLIKDLDRSDFKW